MAADHNSKRLLRLRVFVRHVRETLVIASRDASLENVVPNKSFAQFDSWLSAAVAEGFAPECQIVIATGSVFWAHTVKDILGWLRWVDRLLLKPLAPSVQGREHECLWFPQAARALGISEELLLPTVCRPFGPHAMRGSPDYFAVEHINRWLIWFRQGVEPAECPEDELDGPF